MSRIYNSIMKYYIDLEFLEGKQKETFPISLFRKETKPTIDLISIGIVSEDGRQYYAISKDFNLKEAWNRWQDVKSDGTETNLKFKIGDKRRYRKYWLRDNVLKPICIELELQYLKDYNPVLWVMNQDTDWKSDYKEEFFTYKRLKYLLNKYGKSNKQIAEEIKEFTYYSYSESQIENANIQFYSYFGGYDWVSFCWLFGKMIDLPKGFPMYCVDLKQILDDKIKKSWKDVDMSTWGHIGIENIKKHPNYPKQTNEHNALSDAIWNKQLHEFLNTL